MNESPREGIPNLFCGHCSLPSLCFYLLACLRWVGRQALRSRPDLHSSCNDLFFAFAQNRLRSVLPGILWWWCVIRPSGAAQFNFGVRVHEQVVNQVLTVKLVVRRNALLVINYCRLDGLHCGDGLPRCLPNRLQQVQNPIFPGIFIEHGLQQTVVVNLVAH